MSIPVTDGSFPVVDGPVRTVKDWDRVPWGGKQIELQRGPGGGADVPVPPEEESTTLNLTGSPTLRFK